MMTSQVVRTLEAKGLLARAPHPTDGRAVALATTAEGAALANRATRDVEAADAAYFEVLPPELRGPFLEALRALDEHPR